jgi:hypothetical protein
MEIVFLLKYRISFVYFCFWNYNIYWEAIAFHPLTNFEEGIFSMSRVQTRSVEVKEKPEMGSPFFRSNTGDS